MCNLNLLLPQLLRRRSSHNLGSMDKRHSYPEPMRMTAYVILKLCNLYLLFLLNLEVIFISLSIVGQLNFWSISLSFSWLDVLLVFKKSLLWKCQLFLHWISLSPCWLLRSVNFFFQEEAEGPSATFLSLYSSFCFFLTPVYSLSLVKAAAPAETQRTTCKLILCKFHLNSTF